MSIWDWSRNEHHTSHHCWQFCFGFHCFTLPFTCFLGDFKSLAFLWKGCYRAEDLRKANTKAISSFIFQLFFSSGYSFPSLGFLVKIHLKSDHMLFLIFLLLFLLLSPLLQLRRTPELIEVSTYGPHMAGYQLRNLKKKGLSVWAKYVSVLLDSW